MEKEKLEVDDIFDTGAEPLTGTTLDRAIPPLRNLPIEVTTPQGKKLIFETPERAAKYLPIEADCIQHVLTGILNETNGYTVRYFREKPY